MQFNVFFLIIVASFLGAELIHNGRAIDQAGLLANVTQMSPSGAQNDQKNTQNQSSVATTKPSLGFQESQFNRTHPFISGLKNQNLPALAKVFIAWRKLERANNRGNGTLLELIRQFIRQYAPEMQTVKLPSSKGTQGNVTNVGRKSLVRLSIAEETARANQRMTFQEELFREVVNLSTELLLKLTALSYILQN